MPTRIKSIKLAPHEVEILENLYLKWRIPIEQFESRPDELTAFTEEWNKMSGRSDPAGLVVHCMRTRRKNSRKTLWPTLGTNHTKAPKFEPFSADEVVALVEIYSEIVAAQCYGSDNLIYTDEDLESIVKEFAARTGRVRPAHELNTKITYLRKRGKLTPAAKYIKPDPDVGFIDMDDIQAS